MSIKERPDKQEKEQTKDEVDSVSSKVEEESSEESIEDWLDNYDPKLEKSQKSDSKNTIATEASQEYPPLLKFHQQLPSWIEKPWMYVKPAHDGHLSSWLTSWEKLIISYSSICRQHIVVLTELVEIHPFSHATKQRELSVDQLVTIITHMVNRDLAKWIDQSKQSARIFYRSNEVWAEEIYKYLIETGLAAEVLTLYELKNLDQEWSSLPRQELREVLDVLVRKHQAKWVDDEQEAIKFQY